MANDKTFIYGIYIKEFKFSNGGSKLSVSIKKDKFVEDLEKYVNDKGYVNLEIYAKREADEKGNTHYVTLNTYRREDNNSMNVANEPNATPAGADIDDLPF